MTDSKELGRNARVIIVHMEQAAYKRGHAFIPVVARELKCCETAAQPDAIEGLTELVARGFAEALMPGSRDKRLTLFATPLAREYRLTARGHTWKCNSLRSVNSQVHRLLGH